MKKFENENLTLIESFTIYGKFKEFGEDVRKTIFFLKNILPSNIVEFRTVDGERTQEFVNSFQYDVTSSRSQWVICCTSGRYLLDTNSKIYVYVDNRKKINKPDIDPFQEEFWGHVQENLDINNLQIGDKVKIRDECQYREQAYKNGGDGIGVIIRFNAPPNYDHIYRIRWNNDYDDNYRDMDIIPLSIASKRKIVKRPDIDPFDEETWYEEIKENLDNNDFRVGDRVKLKDGLTSLIDDPLSIIFNKSINQEGIITRISGDLGYPMYVRWDNGRESSYLIDELELVNSKKRKSIKKLDIDPFDEENWYEEIKENLDIEDFYVGDKVKLKDGLISSDSVDDEAYSIGEDKIGTIIEIDRDVTDLTDIFFYNVVWEHVNANYYYYYYSGNEIELVNKRRIKIKKPDIDPFDEENWYEEN